MIIASNAYVSKIGSDSRTFRARFLVDGTVLDCDVLKVEINKGAGVQILPGTIFVPYIEAEIANCNEVLEGADIVFQLGVVLDPSEEFRFITTGENANTITIGKYTVTKSKISIGKTELTAVGYLNSKCNASVTVVAGSTIATVLGQIETATGLAVTLIDLSASGSFTTSFTGTARDVLGEIASMLGGFVSEDNDGGIVIAGYGSGETLAVSGDRMITPPELNDADYYVTGIRVTANGTEYVSGTPNVEYESANMTQALFNQITAGLIGYGFRPGTVDVALGDPRLDPWDEITVPAADGTTCTVPCLSIRHIYDGGLQTNIDATVVSDEEAIAAVQGAVTKAIESVGETVGNILTIAGNTLIYDHDYEISEGVATFTAYLYNGGIDVKTNYDPQQFVWYYKTEDSDELQYIGYGYTCDVTISDMGYGGHVVGHFVTQEDSNLLTGNDDNLTDSVNRNLTARTESGGSVRVSDLTVITTLRGTDKLMVVTAEGERLTTLDTLQVYLNEHLDKQVLFDTTAGWNLQTLLVSDANTLYVYTDHQTDSQGRNVAGIKAGDGNAYLIDMPFVDQVYMDHIADTTVHVTAEERLFWNNKVRCYLANTDELIFTTH